MGSNLSVTYFLLCFYKKRINFISKLSFSLQEVIWIAPFLWIVLYLMNKITLSVSSKWTSILVRLHHFTHAHTHWVGHVGRLWWAQMLAVLIAWMQRASGLPFCSHSQSAGLGFNPPMRKSNSVRLHLNLCDKGRCLLWRRIMGFHCHTSVSNVGVKECVEGIKIRDVLDLMLVH